MNNKADKEYVDKLMELIDLQLSDQNVLVKDRPLKSAIKFVNDFVLRVSPDGQTEEDVKEDFVKESWFRNIYKYHKEWYCQKYGDVFSETSSKSATGLIYLYNSPIKVDVPLWIVKEVVEPGKSAWFTLPNSILDGEDVVSWLAPSPNLDGLSPEELKELCSNLEFVGISIRKIHVNIMTSDGQNEAAISGMLSGILLHLENAAKEIISAGTDGVKYAFWDMHLAAEKSIKAVLLQAGSQKHHHHKLKDLYKQAKEQYGTNINIDMLPNLPKSSEAIKYRYGALPGTTSYYAYSVYKEVLKLIVNTTSALKREIVMNNASFLIQRPPWEP